MDPSADFSGVEVIAHRGASRDAPENTLGAFALAAERKAEWFELDCTLSKDGEIVVIHDDTVDRTAKGAKGRVGDLTYAELAAFDVGSWKKAEFAQERIPTLKQALDLGRDKAIGVYVEVKHQDDAPALRRQVLAAASTERLALLEASACVDLPLAKAVTELVAPRVAAGERIVVQSFSAIICAYVRLKAPGVRVELLVGDVPWDESVEWLDALDLHGLNPGTDVVCPLKVASVRERGKDVSVWTVNDPKLMRKLANWGVKRLITDVPAVCREALGRPKS